MSNGFDFIPEQLQMVRERIRGCAAAVGRSADSVQLLAVSKTFPVEAIQAAYRCGCRCFGESKIQELSLKAAQLPEDIEWHFIGHLQSNKAVAAVELASLIHSVDSEKLLRKLNRAAAETNRCPGILLEVNISGEESKYGLTPDQTKALAPLAWEMEHLRFCGLMTMAPESASSEEIKGIFTRLRELRDDLERNLTTKEVACKLPILSMGMSGDFEEAIAAGATIVRLGSVIFGHRNYAL